MEFNKNIKASDVLKALQGPKGNDGADGIDGIDGIDGNNGIDGKDGAQGLQGVQGDPGPAGIQGPRGPQGPAGEDGRGIRSTKVNNKGHLIITYTDGLELDAGKVKGDEGPQGPRGPSGTVINSGSSGGGGSGDMTKAVYDTTGINEQLVGLTATQTLTNKSGDISQWTNDAGYLTSAPTNQVMIVLGLNDAQSVDSVSDTAINFNTSDIKDTGFTHSTSTNPSRVTVDAAGRYKIEAQISISGTTSNYRLTMQAAVRVNGTTTRQYIDSAYVRANTGSNESNVTVLDVVDLSADDYVEVVVARISSTTGDGTTTANRTKFIMTKVG